MNGRPIVVVERRMGGSLLKEGDVLDVVETEQGLSAVGNPSNQHPMDLDYKLVGNYLVGHKCPYGEKLYEVIKTMEIKVEITE